MAIDADYQNALPDLIKLGYYLKQDGLQLASEKSNRRDLPGFDADFTLFVIVDDRRLALRARAPVSSRYPAFPSMTVSKPGEYGNAIRGPLGIHRGAAKRFWFYGADYDIEKQMRYLNALPKVTGEQLGRLIAGRSTSACAGRTQG